VRLSLPVNAPTFALLGQSFPNSLDELVQPLSSKVRRASTERLMLSYSHICYMPYLLQ
jgi:hypothetical protein